MIHLSKVLSIANTGRPFSIAYIAHGDKYGRRPGGHVVRFEKAMCTSSYYWNRSMNIKNMVNGRIRECKNILIIEFNHEEVMV